MIVCATVLILAITLAAYEIIMLFVTASQVAKENRKFYDWMDSRNV